MSFQYKQTTQSTKLTKAQKKAAKAALVPKPENETSECDTLKGNPFEDEKSECIVNEDTAKDASKNESPEDGDKGDAFEKDDRKGNAFEKDDRKGNAFEKDDRKGNAFEKDDRKGNAFEKDGNDGDASEKDGNEGDASEKRSHEDGYNMVYRKNTERDQLLFDWDAEAGFKKNLCDAYVKLEEMITYQTGSVFSFANIEHLIWRLMNEPEFAARIQNCVFPLQEDLLVGEIPISQYYGMWEFRNMARNQFNEDCPWMGLSIFERNGKWFCCLKRNDVPIVPNEDHVDNDAAMVEFGKRVVNSIKNIGPKTGRYGFNNYAGFLFKLESNPNFAETFGGCTGQFDSKTPLRFKVGGVLKEIDIDPFLPIDTFSRRYLGKGLPMLKKQALGDYGFTIEVYQNKSGTWLASLKRIEGLV